MMVTVATAGMLALVMVPGASELSQSSRVRSTAAQFMNDVNLARSEAIKAGLATVLCPSGDGTSCLRTGEWHRGWLLFVDRDGDREHDLAEPLIRQVGKHAGVSLVTSRSRRRLQMRPTGFSPGSNGTYTVCPAGDGGMPLAVIVANNGRARMARTRPDGGELRCGGA